MIQKNKIITLIVIGALCILLGGAYQQKTNSSAQNLHPIYKEMFMDTEGNKVHLNKFKGKWLVLNFWATWCAPCVKELPYFEAVNKTYKDKNVEVLLVSLDFPRNYERKLKRFIKTHDLRSKNVAFDDTDQNRWIPAINKNWSGAIPATIIYKGDKRQFYERSFTQEELENELNQFLK